MTTLITRPTLDAQETAAFLEKNNISTLIDPMIAIEPLDNVQADITPFNHIIFTSKNGIRAFMNHFDNRDLTAWCVGDETAALALKNGFKTVHSAHGNANDLQRLIVKNLEKQPVLRIWRTHQKDTLSEVLEKQGYSVTSLPLYHPTSQSTLSPATIKALQNSDVTNLVLFSPKTARITRQNIQKADLRDACRSITAWCISKKTADALVPLPFKEIIIAQAPNQDDLLTPLIARMTKNG